MTPTVFSDQAPTALLHGWRGLLLAYGAVQAPLAVGLARGGASWWRVAVSPALAVPLTLAAGAGIAAAASFWPVMHGSLLAGAGAALGCTALSYLGGHRLGTRGDRSGYQRGARVLPPAEAARFQRRSRERSRALEFAGVSVPLADETKHFKLIGTTGTGKSTAIAQLLSGALRRGDRAVIADPDGGYLQRFYDPRRGDVVLNPFEPGSLKWDLFGEIRQPYDVDQLARALLPDQEGSERSWRGYARTFFTAVTQQAQAAGVRELSELYRLLVVADTQELRTLTGGTPAQPFLNEHNGRMFDSIRSVTSSAVGALEYVAQQQAPSFSVRDWIANPERNRGVLFVPYRAGQIAALRSTISAWMRLAIFETMNREEGDQRLWFVVDELDALGPIDGLKDALARARKFGGRCVLGLQSIAQVANTYGAGEAHTIVENCGNSLILRCSASEGGGTARFASTLIGEREVWRTQHSSSRQVTHLFGSVSESRQLALESAVLAAEIEQLPDLAGYLKLASRGSWQPVRLQPAPPPSRSPAPPTGARAAAGPLAAPAAGLSL